MLGIITRWQRTEPLVRAEIIATSWEIFSVLLFSSAVVPLAFSTPWPSAIFVGGLALSAGLARRLTSLGRVGYAVAAAIRALSWLAAITPLLSYEDLRLLIASTGFGLMAGGIRRAIYRRTLDPPTDNPSPVRMRADLRAGLAENAMVAGIVGGHVMLLFSVAFLRTESKMVFRAWWEIIPALAVLGTLGFTLGVRPITDRAHAGLRMGPDGDAGELGAALEQAERIPQRLSYINFAVWLACIAIGVLYFQADQRWNGPDALNQVAFGALFAWGVSFYQRGWHEDAVAPVVARLRQWTGKAAARETVNLRRRMLTQFGGPLLFTLALSLLAAVGLYRTMAGNLSLREDFNAITALGASFGMLVLAVGGVFLRAARQLSEPLAMLANAADDVASGKLEAEVPPVIAPVEVVGLGASIERMRQALARTIAELKEERAHLEVNVALRTSELAATVEELKEAQTALIQGERMALIGELVAGVAHEIYNPLNAISGSISALERVREELLEMLDAYRTLEDSLPEAEREAIRARRARIDLDGTFGDLEGVVKVVQKATQRAVDIVAHLKSFSRAPSEPIPADIHDGLRETLGLLGHRIRHAGIEVIEDFGDVPEVVCRAGEINQVFMNLLTNAIHASLERHGHGGGVIAVRTSADKEAASVAISDNGTGVPKELHKRIFDPFFTTKARGEGTGLGLSISTEIVRRHGGRLWVEADPELGGARFVCRLPLQPARRSIRGARPPSEVAVERP
jgi:two-component system, NtrC family, sensor kinase